MTRRTRVAGVAVVVVLVAGCDAGGDAARVSEDPDATTAEVIDAGAASDVAVDAEGRRLVSWYAAPADDEAPGKAAWRLSDGRGETVAEGQVPQAGDRTRPLEVAAVDGGFLLFTTAYGVPRVLRVAADGETGSVPRTAPAPSRPGDVILGYSPGYPARVWSAVDDTVHRLPRPPRRDLQDVAVDAQGATHVLLPPQGRVGVVLSSADGEAPWRRSTVPLPRRGGTGDLARVGDDVLLLTSVRGEVDAVWRLVDGAWSREVEVPPGVEDGTGEVEVTALDDAAGRHLVLEGDRATWVLDDGWRRVEQPAAEGRVLVAGDRLWFLDDVDGDLSVSADLGASWQEVAR